MHTHWRCSKITAFLFWFSSKPFVELWFGTLIRSITNLYDEDTIGWYNNSCGKRAYLESAKGIIVTVISASLKSLHSCSDFLQKPLWRFDLKLSHKKHFCMTKCYWDLEKKPLYDIIIAVESVLTLRILHSHQPNSPQVGRKYLRPDNKKHFEEEDNWSVASSYPFCSLDLRISFSFHMQFDYSFLAF